jgi:hypothetical protein
MPAAQRHQVFISYSHEDGRKWLRDLLVHLKPLERNGKLSAWSDEGIRPGAIWREEIATALSSAKVAVLLVTPQFLASEFIAQNELPPLLKAAEEEGLKILWVAVSATVYEESGIAGYQAVNDPSQPLDSLTPAQQNQELVHIAREIMAAVNPSIPAAGTRGSRPALTIGEGAGAAPFPESAVQRLEAQESVTGGARQPDARGNKHPVAAPAALDVAPTADPLQKTGPAVMPGSRKSRWKRFCDYVIEDAGREKPEIPLPKIGIRALALLLRQRAGVAISGLVILGVLASTALAIFAPQPIQRAQDFFVKPASPFKQFYGSVELGNTPDKDKWIWPPGWSFDPKPSGKDYYLVAKGSAPGFFRGGRNAVLENYYARFRLKLEPGLQRVSWIPAAKSVNEYILVDLDLYPTGGGGPIARTRYVTGSSQRDLSEQQMMWYGQVALPGNFLDIGILVGNHTVRQVTELLLAQGRTLSPGVALNALGCKALDPINISFDRGYFGFRAGSRPDERMLVDYLGIFGDASLRNAGIAKHFDVDSCL